MKNKKPRIVNGKGLPKDFNQARLPNKFENLRQPIKITCREDLKRLEDIPDSGVYAEVNLDLIDLHSELERKYVDEDEFKRLKQSIEKFNIIELPTLGFADNNLTVISGVQRLKAWKELGYKEAQCRILKLGRFEVDWRIIEANYRRTEYAPLDRAYQVAKFMEKYSLSTKQMAGMLDVSPDAIELLKRIDRLPEDFKQRPHLHKLTLHNYKEIISKLEKLNVEEFNRICDVSKNKGEFLERLKKLAGRRQKYVAICDYCSEKIYRDDYKPKPYHKKCAEVVDEIIAEHREKEDVSD
jgi:ParB-like chromosome segregation protein Spo0J